MKTKTVVTEITHDELVTLLSAAIYSEWLYFSIPKISDSDVPRVNGECCEDRWARILLAGNPIYVDDYFAEDEEDFYGNLPHVCMCQNSGTFMRYTLTLEDIKNGIARALDYRAYHIVKYINNWQVDSCQYDVFDITQAEAIIQWIVFGHVIYG